MCWWHDSILRTVLVIIFISFSSSSSSFFPNLHPFFYFLFFINFAQSQVTISNTSQPYTSHRHTNIYNPILLVRCGRNLMTPYATPQLSTGSRKPLARPCDSAATPQHLVRSRDPSATPWSRAAILVGSSLPSDILLRPSNHVVLVRTSLGGFLTHLSFFYQIIFL